MGVKARLIYFGTRQFFVKWRKQMLEIYQLVMFIPKILDRSNMRNYEESTEIN